jgi:site-specific recombinase XerD
MRTWARANGNDHFLEKYRAPKIAEPQPHPLPEGQQGVLRMILAAKCPRQQALVALCGLVGLRVSEACSIKPGDIDLETNQIRVRGKGDKERLVPLGGLAWGYIKPAHIIASWDGCEFIIEMQERWARRCITQLGEKAALSRPVSSHDLRATFATHLLRNGTNVRVIQKILGHAHLETTMVYLAATDDDMRKAVV